MGSAAIANRLSVSNPVDSNDLILDAAKRFPRQQGQAGVRNRRCVALELRNMPFQALDFPRKFHFAAIAAEAGLQLKVGGLGYGTAWFLDRVAGGVARCRSALYSNRGGAGRDAFPSDRPVGNEYLPSRYRRFGARCNRPAEVLELVEQPVAGRVDVRFGDGRAKRNFLPRA